MGCALNRQLLRRLTHPEAGPPDVADLERRVSALLDLVGPSLGFAD
ncbi:hypothetical protein [Cereibacter sphaeroides]